MSGIASDSEHEALLHIVQRLSERFPDLGAERIREITAAEFASFEGAHVRDFVPVLVERRVQERLRAERLPVT